MPTSDELFDAATKLGEKDPGYAAAVLAANLARDAEIKAAKAAKAAAKGRAPITPNAPAKGIVGALRAKPVTDADLAAAFAEPPGLPIEPQPAAVPMGEALRAPEPPPEAPPPPMGAALRTEELALPPQPPMDYTQTDVGTLGAFGSNRLRALGADLRSGAGAGKRGVPQTLAAARLLNTMGNQAAIARRGAANLTQRQDEEKALSERAAAGLADRQAARKTKADADLTKAALARSQKEEDAARKVRENLSKGLSIMDSLAKVGPANSGLISGAAEAAYRQWASDPKGWKPIVAGVLAPESWKKRRASAESAVAELARQISGLVTTETERANIRGFVAPAPGSTPETQLDNLMRYVQSVDFKMENLPEAERPAARAQIKQRAEALQRAYSFDARKLKVPRPFTRADGKRAVLTPDTDPDRYERDYQSLIQQGFKEAE